ncbi:MAG TPA: ribulose-phosphate 3-epimerase [Streptosporangiaceae bacterium]|nr:ribulose-phosphate 3-epimerase [Streptosporangiaceae bacterium]
MTRPGIAACSRPVIDLSLWSADLAALGHEVRRMSPLVDSFHIDVSDTRFTPGLVFGPDLVAAVRPYSTLPFHIHLMTADPAALVEPFAQAGADAITVHAETGNHEAAEAIQAIRSCGKSAGVALRVDTDPRAAMAFLGDADRIVMVGTPLGTKGSELVPGAVTRLRTLRRLLDTAAGTANVTILADGGIRQDTISPLLAAGADGVVAGSLLFASRDPAATAAWVHGLGREAGS